MRTHKSVTHSSLCSKPTNFVNCDHQFTTNDGVSLTTLYFHYPLGSKLSLFVECAYIQTHLHWYIVLLVNLSLHAVANEHKYLYTFLYWDEASVIFHDTLPSLIYTTNITAYNTIHQDVRYERGHAPERLRMIREVKPWRRSKTVSSRTGRLKSTHKQTDGRTDARTVYSPSLRSHLPVTHWRRWCRDATCLGNETNRGVKPWPWAYQKFSSVLAPGPG